MKTKKKLKCFSELSENNYLKGNCNEEFALKKSEKVHVSYFEISTWNYVESEKLTYKDYRIIIDRFSHFNAGIITVKTPNENGFLKVLKNNKKFNLVSGDLIKLIKKEYEGGYTLMDFKDDQDEAGYYKLYYEVLSNHSKENKEMLLQFTDINYVQETRTYNALEQVRTDIINHKNKKIENMPIDISDYGVSVNYKQYVKGGFLLKERKALPKNIGGYVCLFFQHDYKVKSEYSFIDACILEENMTTELLIYKVDRPLRYFNEIIEIEDFKDFLERLVYAYGIGNGKIEEDATWYNDLYIKGLDTCILYRLRNFSFLCEKLLNIENARSFNQILKSLNEK